jgi:hypothetical protein
MVRLSDRLQRLLAKLLRMVVWGAIRPLLPRFVFFLDTRSNSNVQPDTIGIPVKDGKDMALPEWDIRITRFPYH